MLYIQFVWDDQKGQANARKHEVTFEEAKSAFSIRTPGSSTTPTIPGKRTASSWWG